MLAIVLGGCFGGVIGGGGNSRPAAIPMLSELPDDPGKRDAILDSADTTAGPEQRKGETKKERKAETAAAFAAAIIGSMFSTTQNTTLGGATSVGGPAKLDQTRRARDAGSGAGSSAAPPPAPDPVRASELVPWVKLK